MRNKKLPLNFNSGLLEYGKIETKRDDNGKKVRGKNFQSVGEMYFNFENIRQRDLELYQSSDQKLDLKVQTHYICETLESHEVRIENELYNITHVDPNNEKTTLYWYLSKWGGGKNG